MFLWLHFKHSGSNSAFSLSYVKERHWWVFLFFFSGRKKKSLFSQPLKAPALGIKKGSKMANVQGSWWVGTWRGGGKRHMGRRGLQKYQIRLQNKQSWPPATLGTGRQTRHTTHSLSLGTPARAGIGQGQETASPPLTLTWRVFLKVQE